jgi:hypothetical protein
MSDLPHIRKSVSHSLAMSQAFTIQQKQLRYNVNIVDTYVFQIQGLLKSRVSLGKVLLQDNKVYHCQSVVLRSVHVKRKRGNWLGLHPLDYCCIIFRMLLQTPLSKQFRVVKRIMTPGNQASSIWTTGVMEHLGNSRPHWPMCSQF